MLGGVVMKHLGMGNEARGHRSLTVAVLSLAAVAAVPVLAGCENSYDAPAPATPANAQDVPPPAPVDSAAAQAQGDDAMYASGEYAIGDDGDSYDDNDPSALTDFHGALDSHGAWVDDPTYGTVWVPSSAEVGADFVPYESAGHWVYDDDYVWVSDYEWGWAPFHYGRWVYVDGRGWAWVPGRVYAGAWVEWGWDDGYGYVGWYPMAPAFFWFGGVAVAYSFYVGPSWVYCPRTYVFAPVVATHVVAGPAVAGVAARVTTHVSASPRLGPSPEKLGYSASQIPHSSASPQVARAQQFSRPSTATALGAHPAFRPTGPGPGGSGYAGGRPFGTGGVTPTQQPRRRSTTPEGAPQVRRGGGLQPGGGYHPPPSTGGTFRGGGGTFHGGGGGHSGGHR
jgi:hypothetical protein